MEFMNTLKGEIGGISVNNTKVLMTWGGGGHGAVKDGL